MNHPIWQCNSRKICSRRILNFDLYSTIFIHSPYFKFKPTTNWPFPPKNAISTQIFQVYFSGGGGGEIHGRKTVLWCNRKIDFWREKYTRRADSPTRTRTDAARTARYLIFSSSSCQKPTTSAASMKKWCAPGGELEIAPAEGYSWYFFMFSVYFSSSWCWKFNFNAWLRIVWWLLHLRCFRKRSFFVLLFAVSFTTRFAGCKK